MTDKYFSLTLGLTLVTALGAITTGLVKRVAHKRALARLSELPCAHCGAVYGANSLRNITRLRYHWTPMGGSTLACMGLPGSTFLVKCPHCAEEAEFRDDGRIFIYPLAGASGYTTPGILFYRPKA